MIEMTTTEFIRFIVIYASVTLLWFGICWQLWKHRDDDDDDDDFRGQKK